MTYNTISVIIYIYSYNNIIIHYNYLLVIDVLKRGGDKNAMWNEMSYNKYRIRSNHERLLFENDKPLRYDTYTETIIEEQEQYDLNVGGESEHDKVWIKD